MKTFYIIDGSAYIYRAYHAIRSLSTRSGLPTNAVYGVVQMLLKLVRAKKPDYIACAFDAREATFRHQMYAEYKAHRPKMPEELSLQIPYIHRVVAALSIPMMIQPGYEADDLIGTLARRAEAAGVAVVIVSGDKDMFQLISPQVTLYDPLKEKVYGETEVEARFGLKPVQMVEMMGLMGDAVDNIPGVSGIGEKTAIRLIQQFQTLDHLLSHLDQIKKEGLRETLRQEQDMARLSRDLARIDTQCPMAFDLAKFQVASPSLERLAPLCRELEFSSLLRELTPACKGIPPESYDVPSHPQQGSQGPKSSHDSQPSQALTIETLTTPDAIANLIQKINVENEVAFVLLFSPTEPLSLEGVFLSCQIGTVGFLPVSHGEIPFWLQEIFASETLTKISHNLKPTLTWFTKTGVTMRGPQRDTLIAAYLLNPGQRDYSLTRLAQNYLQTSPLPERSSHSATETGIDPEARIHDAAYQADLILQLSDPIHRAIQGEGMLSLLTDIEMPLVALLSQMEQQGMRVNVPLLNELSKEMAIQLAELTTRIHRLAGVEFNINSPKQLSEVLFQRLNLPVIRKTKTGFSTDEDVLTQLAVLHELPSELLNSRQLTKLKSTYIDPLPHLVSKETGRVHTQFNQAVTATGRLSSSEPNLQNIPIRGEMGQKIRQAFVAKPGHRLLSADYNQIELRILAHLSEDASLIESFLAGGDVHTQTAVQIFGLSREEISTEMRRVAKTVNFGVIYGISPFGLSTNLGLSQPEAKRYITRYFEHYQGVRRFMDAMIETARTHGYVVTLFNRKRRIDEINSNNKKLREAGERLAMNSPIQGSAADIIKVAMLSIGAWMAREQVASRMILQVHDELIFEVPEEEVSLMKEGVIPRMEGAIALKVPLTVNLGIGMNWREIH